MIFYYYNNDDKYHVEKHALLVKHVPREKQDKTM